MNKQMLEEINNDLAIPLRLIGKQKGIIASWIIAFEDNPVHDSKVVELLKNLEDVRAIISDTIQEHIQKIAGKSNLLSDLTNLEEEK